MEIEDPQRVHSQMSVPHLVVRISSPERLRMGYLKDLSQGSLFVKTERPLQLDRLVDVDLLAPGHTTPIRVRCRVVRVRNEEGAKQSKSQGMGLKFVDLEPGMIVALDALLNEYQGTRTPDALPMAPSDDSLQLKRALEEIAALAEPLADPRREEVPTAAPAPGAPSDEMQRELETARASAVELQTHLSEALGDVEAYRHELAAMEEDNARVRALAESEKLELDALNARRLTQAAEELKEERALRVVAERREAVLEGERLLLTTRLEESQSLLKAAREQIAVLERGTAKPVTPGGSDREEQFLRRLRANEPLLRLARFNTFTPSDPRESAVMGLLEGCDRYCDLLVLSRSMATPNQLERMLLGFHQLTLIGFDR